MSLYFTNFNYNDASNNKLPIINSTFICGICALTMYPTTKDNSTYWMALPVSNILTSNNNLVTINNSGGLVFNVSGVYQLTTNLLFTGSGFGSNNQNFFGFSYSTSANNTSSSFISGSPQISGTSNSIAGPIYMLDGSTNTIFGTNALFIEGTASGGSGNYKNGYSSSNYGGQIVSVSTSGTSGTPTVGNSPPFFLLPNFATSSSITDSTNPCIPINTVNAKYYIPYGTPLYFNFTNTGGDNTLNASANFTIQLLYNCIPTPTLSAVTNIANTTLYNSSNTYYYVFYPSTVGTSTAIINFNVAVTMYYLLVGGGGGGATVTSYTNIYGGAGGGGQIINGTAGVSGNIFTISIGSGGAGGTNVSVNGNAGGQTTLTVGTNVIVAGGGGGATSPTGGAGGGTGTSAGALGGNGYTSSAYATNGGDGQTISISAIGQTYAVGGAGGGGGSNGGFPYGGIGGNNNIGGAAGGNGATNMSGSNGIGYGTGGGGSYYENTNTVGGNGGSGLVVLYWQQ